MVTEEMRSCSPSRRGGSEIPSTACRGLHVSQSPVERFSLLISRHPSSVIGEKGREQAPARDVSSSAGMRPRMDLCASAAGTLKAGSEG